MPDSSVLREAREFETHFSTAKRRAWEKLEERQCSYNFLARERPAKRERAHIHHLSWRNCNTCRGADRGQDSKLEADHSALFQKISFPKRRLFRLELPSNLSKDLSVFLPLNSMLSRIMQIGVWNNFAADHISQTQECSLFINPLTKLHPNDLLSCLNLNSPA